MEAAGAMGMLEEVARGRAPERTGLRLATADATLGDAIGRVEAEILACARTGQAPAIDSAEHLRAAGGKRVRPLLALLSCASFGPVGRGVEVAVAAELVHLATLLHDDVVDDGSERRGVPTSRRLWGNAVSVLAGDLLLVHALERVRAAGEGVTLAELLATLRSLVDGEVVQLRGRTRLDLSRATYDEIVLGKTASLFVWAMRAGARAGGGDPAAIERLGLAGSALGQAFQIVDDVIDYEPGASRKTPFADLREGKVTLPLILLAERDGRARCDIEAARDAEPAGVAALLERVRASSVLSESREIAAAHAARAANALAELPASGPRAWLVSIADRLAGRRT